MFSSYVDVIFRLCSCAVFWVCARVCALYIYMAFRMHLRRGLRQLFFSGAVCVSYVFGAFSMQSCLCTCKQSSFHWAFPWYFLYVPRICSMYCLVTPSIGLHQSFPLFLGWWFLYLSFTPPYTSNIFSKRDLRQVCASHFFWGGAGSLFFLILFRCSVIFPYDSYIRPRHSSYSSLYLSYVLHYFLAMFTDCSWRLLLFFLYFPLLFAPYWRLILSRPLRWDMLKKQIIQRKSNGIVYRFDCFFIFWAPCGSSPTIGSSTISRSGSCSKEADKTNLCFIPWE